MIRKSRRKLQRKNTVAAFRSPILDYVLPLFAVLVFLLLRPWISSGEVNGLGIRRPGEGVNFLCAQGNRKCLAARRRNQINLIRAFFVGFVVVRIFNLGGLFFAFSIGQ